MSIDLETFVKELTESGIIAPGRLENFIPPKAHPQSAEELVAELVKENQLTNYQAEEINEGRGKSLMLGGYTILDKIGAGGMGQVFKAEHRRMDRKVAIKMLPTAMTKDAAAVARFEREVRAAAKLFHPNIVPALDADQANGVHFLVMEYVDGKDLSALVKNDGPFPVAKAVNYILQAAKGLEFAHKKGVIHRDIKPANLLLDGEGTVRILDMGLARIEEGDGPVQAELTGTGAVMGTVDYMAPEQGLSTKHADARADIYSLGCTLYYLIAGKPTYDGETVAAKLVAHHTRPIPSLREVQPDIPKQVEAVFKKMVAKTVEDRYQTMSQVVAALEKCQATLKTEATTEATAAWQSSDTKEALSAAGGKKPPRKNVTLLAGAAGFLVVLLGVIVIVRNKDGKEVARLEVPDANSVEVQPTPEKATPVISAKLKTTFKEPAFQQWMKDVASMPADKQIAAVSRKLVELNPGFDGAVMGKDENSTPKIENGVVTELGVLTDNVTDISPVRALAELQLLKCATGGTGKGKLADLSPLKGMTLTYLYCHNTQVSDLSLLRGMPLTKLGLSWSTNVADLSPLQGMPLAYLNCCGLRISDLTPLKGMPLTFFECESTRVSDLSPLEGMKLTTLKCAHAPVSDLSPLRGMPLTSIYCQGSKVSDLTPLQGMNLKDVRFTPQDITKGMGTIRQMKSVQVIGTSSSEKFPPTEFWRKYDAGEFGKPAAPAKLAYLDPAFQQWVKETQALPAEKQVEAVSKKLIELNPGFDGKVTGVNSRPMPNIENGVVTEFGLLTDSVTDLSPVQALGGVRRLACYPEKNTGKSKLSDLSPLQGLPLTYLDVHYAQVSDLSPLKEMPLTIMNCSRTQVSDLSPLRGMPLKDLNCPGTKVSDLSPLSGAPLTKLGCGSTPVSDLSPLKGMPLGSLYCDDSQVSDLSPLEDCKSLKTLNVTRTKVTPAQVAAVQKALPNCKVEWDDPAKPTTPLAVSNVNPDRLVAEWVLSLDDTGKQNQVFVHETEKAPVRLNPGTTVPQVPFKVVQIWLDRVPIKEADLMGFKDLAGLDTLYLLGLDISETGLATLAAIPKLGYLNLSSSTVTDSGLKGISRAEALETLWLPATQITDEGLKLLPSLKNLRLLNVMKTKVTATGVAALQKALPNCKIDWDDPAQAAAPQPNQPWNTPAFQQWMKEVQAMPAEDQIKAVSKKLVELNPGFDGKVIGWHGSATPKIENGVVTAFGFVTDKVTDISPVRALLGLTALKCVGSGMGNAGTGKVADLSPLHGLPLVALDCGHNQVSNLSPLAGMRLTELRCGDTKVSDLSPLQGMPVTNLMLHITKVSDLSPLHRMPLTNLTLQITSVSDLTPLEGMNLIDVNFTPGSISKGLDILRQMKSLSAIRIGIPSAQGLPPTEFWRKYDAGEFGKPITTFSPAFQEWMKDVVVLPAEKQIEAVSKKLMELNPGFDGKLGESSGSGKLFGSPKVEYGVVTTLAFISENVTDISPLRALSGLNTLSCAGSGNKKSQLSDLSPLQGLFLTHLTCGRTQVSDLSPLRGMKLKDVNFYLTPVNDLSPLKGMELTGLGCEGTQVSSLLPLAGMPLTNVFCMNAPVSDLTPLQDCKRLTTLNVTRTKVTPTQVDALQKALPNCKIEWDDPSKAAATQPNKPWNTPAFQTWVKDVAAMPADKQIDAVAQKLQELNPGFDGKVTGWDGTGSPKIEKAIVTEFGFLNDNVTDISPVRALSGLNRLQCGGRGMHSGKLADLTPLNGMALTGFDCRATLVADLSPLVGMKLTTLWCNGSQVSNLALLKGMKLTNFDCGGTAVSDLSPLQGMELTHLKCHATPVSDLSPLRGLPLTFLDCNRTKISSLSPLKGMPLEKLACYNTSISDLSALKGMKLTELNCGDTLVGDLSPLQGMPIKSLTFGSTNVADLSPLTGMPLSTLICYGKSVSDLSPLQGMNLTDVSVTPKSITKGMAVLRQMKSIKSIGVDNNKRMPSDDFWKKYDAGEFGKPAGANQPWNTPAFQAWVKEVQAMPAEEQVKAVSKKLTELNPGFDGKVTGDQGKPTPKIEKGVVTEFQFVGDNMVDISPLRALPGLTVLICGGTRSGRGQFSDLIPLQEMKLSILYCNRTSVSDLAPLKGMPLIRLNCGETKVSDLAPLQGMPLSHLWCGYTPISDLSPLQDCKSLISFDAKGTKVTAAGVAALQKALPNCKIEWDDPAKVKTPEPAASGTK